METKPLETRYDYVVNADAQRNNTVRHLLSKSYAIFLDPYVCSQNTIFSLSGFRIRSQVFLTPGVPHLWEPGPVYQ